jgi:hypothetical protein
MVKHTIDFVRRDWHRSALAMLFVVAAVAGGGCETSSEISSSAPTSVKCEVSMSSIPTVDAGGGRGSFSVTAQPECAWEASTTVSWISGLSPASGQGSSTIAFSVAPNESTDTRDGAIVVNGQELRVSQRASCRYTLSPTNQNVGESGGSGSVTVSTASECAWTAATDASWITLSAPASGNGNGTVAFIVAANSGEQRTGNVIVAGVRATVMQAAANTAPPTPPPTPPPPSPSCSYSIAPSSQNVGAAASTGTVTVTAGSGCAWTATSNATWLTIASGATGTGNGAVGFSVAANTGATRTGTATIATQTFTVTQAAANTPPPPPPPSPACTYSIAPPSQNVGAGAATGTVTVTAGAGCAWTATSNAAWIAITSGATGTGNGSVGFSVAANTGAARTGAATIATQTFTVTQAAGAAPCTYSISPTEANIGPDAAQGTVTVTAGAGCAWTATSNAAWITVTAGATGTGNGTVVLGLTANTGAERTGTVTIASQTFTVTQRTGVASCSYSISPTNQSVGSGATTGTVAVTTASGCTWTAASSAPWLTVTQGASGSGDGSVGFSVAANTGAARTATLTIGGQIFTLTQAAFVAPCTYAISPTSQTVSAAGGSGTVNVTTASGCGWTASSNVSWITVTSGATGTGNGSVAFTVGINNAASRSGTLTIAGQAFTVTQGAAPGSSTP